MKRTITVMQSFGVPRPTTNPYIVMLAAKLNSTPGVKHVPFTWYGALTSNYDVLHVHWPDTLLTAKNPLKHFGKRIAFVLLLARIRAQKIAIVRTVHNPSPHESTRIDRVLINHMEKLTTLRIRINPATQFEDGVPNELILHGHYRDWFSPVEQCEPTIGHICYVGLIRPYKGVEDLIIAFKEASLKHPSLTLTIAGKPNGEEVAANLFALAGQASNIQLELTYVSEERLAEIVRSSELVVLPYRQMHNSGVALAALSLDRPVLVPQTRTNEELADEVGPGWVHYFKDRVDSESLYSAIHRSRRRVPSTCPMLDARNWEDTGTNHLRVYLRAIRIMQTK